MYTIRPLLESDYHNNYFEVLQQLTTAPKCSYTDFVSQLRRMEQLPGHLILVALSPTDFKVIGCISMFIEPKFIHSLQPVLHVEDVVVDVAWRNKHVGTELLQKAYEYAQDNNCYKIILDCSPRVATYYERLGFEFKNVQMSAYAPFSLKN